ncbi:MAG: site-2 protease family protein [Defluviitaleaceae bacterium]|nr:site-2 protease family protein [Defluviitaleaceae bacterium]
MNKVKLSLVGFSAWVHKIDKHRYMIYLAGPLINAAIAFGALTLGQSDIFIINIVLCGFNLLPVFPLDGGRIAQLFLGNRIGIIRANRVLIKVGIVVGGILMGFGLVQVVLYPWNMTLLCAGFYIRKKNKELPTYLYWECIQALKSKKDSLPRKKIILPQNTTINQAVEYLRWDYLLEIYIDNNQYISERELLTDSKLKL